MKIQIAHPRRRSLIGLTPLIDVVFILLFFFMLASSLDNWQGMDFHLGGTTATLPPAQDTLQFVVHPGGAVERKDQRFGLSAFIAYVESQPPDTTIVLVPAADTPLQDLIGVVDAARLAGLQRVVFGLRE
ncbi:ExbD/TolR family protein [Thiosocius teredinicola]|uniref:ExbD/TolR family protein n=1 Tax=Thiosocius teredinicola TaxID=1973002 RepID=UPI0009912B45